MKNDIVHYTTDYESIVFSPENRTVNVNSQKYRDMKESIKTIGQVVPAIVDRVDGKFVLAEGQHRLDIAKELGTEFSYVIRLGSVAHIRELNSRRINWTTNDYIASSKNDNPAYRYFDQLLKDSGLPVPALYHALFGKTISMDEFREGRMQLTYNQAQEFRAEVLPKLLRIVNVNERRHRNQLIGAKCIGVLVEIIRNSAYDHDHFVTRMNKTAELMAMTTRKNAETVLLEIYNTRLSKDKKIRITGEN